MHIISNSESLIVSAPRVVVFEGVDGTGKTTFARALGRYYQQLFPTATVLQEAFPGSRPGTLGNWVYQLHHADTNSSLDPRSIAPAALQLLHVAAHVDAILTRFAPAFSQPNSFLILDRYWWSTYAYARLHLTQDEAHALVHPEQMFWKSFPPPNIVYLSRHQSLKGHEIDPSKHKKIDSHYREIISEEHQHGVKIHEIPNDGTINDTWAMLLTALGLSAVNYTGSV